LIVDLFLPPQQTAVAWIFATTDNCGSACGVTEGPETKHAMIIG